MKTIEQWFTDHLPADIGALAIRNTDDSLLEIEMTSLSKAIRDSFVWVETPQGFQFWRELFEDVKAREDFMASKDVEAMDAEWLERERRDKILSGMDAEDYE